ncbi:MAG: sugar ABC transporter substrate-binding protein [Nakamurella sp.]
MKIRSATVVGIAALMTLAACSSNDAGGGSSSVAAGGSSAAGGSTAAGGSSAAGASGGASFSDSPSGYAESAVAAVPATGKKLTVWIMQGTNPDATPFFAEVAKDFKAQTGADLDVQFQPWASAHDKFTTAIAGGTTPDVAEVGTTWTPEFAQAGALEDLSSMAKPMMSNLVQGLVDAGTIDGKLYGMPWYAGVRSFVYNKDVFAKAGITTPPANWAELEADGKKIKAADSAVVPFAVAGDCSYCMLPFVWGAGGDVAKQENGKWTSTIDSPESQAGLTFYTDLAIKDGLSTPAAATWKETDLLKNFEAGKLGMVISGNWTISTIEKDVPEMKGKLGAFPIPGKTSGISPSFLGGSHLSIFQASQNKELGWKFIQLMSTDKYADGWASQSNFFPGTKTLLDKSAKSSDPLVAPFAKQMVEAGKSMPVTPAWGQIEGAKVTTKMLQSVLTGKSSVADATKQATAKMNSTFGS